MEKEWKIPAVWQMMGYIRVPAPTAEEALKRAQMIRKTVPYPMMVNTWTTALSSILKGSL